MMSDYLSTLNPTKVATAIENVRVSVNPHVVQLREYAGGDLRFATWWLMVDRACMRKIGLTTHDIADYTWRDAYDDGMSPSDALADALASDDIYSMMGE